METMEGMERGINRQRIGRMFGKACVTYDEAAIAQQRIARRAAAILQSYGEQTGFNPSAALEIGCGTGLFTRHLQRLYPSTRWTLNDIQDACARQALSYCQAGTEFVCADAASLGRQGHFPLVASASVFQWIAAPARFVRQIASWQQAGDVLLFTTFLPENMQEIRQLTGDGLTYPDSSDWRAWLEADYGIRTMEDEVIKLQFPSARDVLLHLRHTGVTATNQAVWTPHRLREFCRTYEARFRTTEGNVVLTYRPIYILAVKQ